MRLRFPLSLPVCLGCALATLLASGASDSYAQFQQIGRALGAQDADPFQQVEDAAVRQEEDMGEGTDEGGAEGEAVEDETVIELPREEVKLSPQEIRLHLVDGSVVTGELGVSELRVTTDFGELIIPIDRIRSLRPGLDSYPTLRGARLDETIGKLSSEDYQERETAEKSLIAEGLRISTYIDGVGDDGDSERQRRLENIRKAFAELKEDLEFSEFETDGEDQPLILGDTIVTDQFTIVGKIQNESFVLASKYGQLTVVLEDVSRGVRDSGGRGSITRTVSVAGTNLIQRSTVSSKIRVQRGDRIVVKVEGTVYLSPWDETSTPDGVPNYGNYMGKFPIGSVVAKIGGEMVLVGREKSFIAPRSGTLEFGMAMMDNFADSGYEWPGEYKVRIRVEPQ